MLKVERKVGSIQMKEQTVDAQIDGGSNAEYDWNMETIRIQSISKPFSDSNISEIAVQIVFRAQGMGLLSGLSLTSVDPQSFGKVIERIQNAGIKAKWEKSWLSKKPAALVLELRKLLSVLNESPVPEAEWSAVMESLGQELVRKLLDLSVSSIQRYSSNSRPTPQNIAEKLHYLAVVIGDLRAGYNDYGIRRWFERPRTFLSGKSVLSSLGKKWGPDDEVARAIAEDAAWVAGSGAA